jgi:hypothetical protein
MRIIEAGCGWTIARHSTLVERDRAVIEETRRRERKERSVLVTRTRYDGSDSGGDGFGGLFACQQACVTSTSTTGTTTSNKLYCDRQWASHFETAGRTARCWAADAAGWLPSLSGGRPFWRGVQRVISRHSPRAELGLMQRAAQKPAKDRSRPRAPPLKGPTETATPWS